MIWYFYSPQDGGKRVSIGSYTFPPGGPKVAAVAVIVEETADREEAERWRQALARGEFPRTSKDRPEGQS